MFLYNNTLIKGIIIYNDETSKIKKIKLYLYQLINLSTQNITKTSSILMADVTLTCNK